MYCRIEDHIFSPGRTLLHCSTSKKEITGEKVSGLWAFFLFSFFARRVIFPGRCVFARLFPCFPFPHTAKRALTEERNWLFFALKKEILFETGRGGTEKGATATGRVDIRGEN